ncbi:MAG: hypothetical protein ACXVCP_02945 [Bdellovibrio sp.]
MKSFILAILGITTSISFLMINDASAENPLPPVKTEVNLNEKFCVDAKNFAEIKVSAGVGTIVLHKDSGDKLIDISVGYGPDVDSSGSDDSIFDHQPILEVTGYGLVNLADPYGPPAGLQLFRLKNSDVAGLLSVDGVALIQLGYKSRCNFR